MAKKILRKNISKRYKIYAVTFFIILLLVMFVNLKIKENHELKLSKELEQNCVNSMDGEINKTFDEPKRFQVSLKSRYFIPPEGIECNLLKTLRENSGGDISVLMQFDPPIGSAEDRAKYKHLGIKLDGYIPMDTWEVVVPADLIYLNNLIEKHNIRWIGEFVAEDKISSYIKEGRIGDWAISEEGDILVIVQFTKDTSPFTAIKTIFQKRGEPKNFPFFTDYYYAKIPEDKIYSLAKDYRVTWIELIPPPPVNE